MRGYEDAFRRVLRYCLRIAVIVMLDVVVAVLRRRLSLNDILMKNLSSCDASIWRRIAVRSDGVRSIGVSCVTMKLDRLVIIAHLSKCLRSATRIFSSS